MMNRELLLQRLEENPFQSLNHIVYQMLEEAILSFELLPKTKLNSAKIAKDLQISRTPIKEAFRTLCKEGLVERREDKNGYYVFTFSRQMTEELFFARRVIEGTACYLCAQHNRSVDVRQLRYYAEEFREILHTKQYTKLDETDIPFHKIIVQAAGNPFLVTMYETLDRMIRYQSARNAHYLRSTGQVEYKMDGLALQHLSILKAIESGIPEMAQSAAHAHIDTCVEFTRLHPMY